MGVSRFAPNEKQQQKNPVVSMDQYSFVRVLRLALNEKKHPGASVGQYASRINGR